MKCLSITARMSDVSTTLYFSPSALKYTNLLAVDEEDEEDEDDAGEVDDYEEEEDDDEEEEDDDEDEVVLEASFFARCWCNLSIGK